MRILVVDFYDSFVFNLVHYFESNGCEVEVTDDAALAEMDFQVIDGFQGVVLSPGPGLPTETKSMMKLIEYCKGKIPVFGVCLGMQGLGLSLGGELYNLQAIRHGISRQVTFSERSIFYEGIENLITVGLYHSWAVRGLPNPVVSALDDEGVVMAVESPSTLQYGVQFHPESVMTPLGMKFVKNVISKIF